jgi:hypothetical protein
VNISRAAQPAVVNDAGWVLRSDWEKLSANPPRGLPAFSLGYPVFCHSWSPNHGPSSPRSRSRHNTPPNNGAAPGEIKKTKVGNRLCETQKAIRPGLGEKQGWLRPKAGFDRSAMIKIPPGSSDERSGGTSMAARQAFPPSLSRAASGRRRS